MERTGRSRRKRWLPVLVILLLAGSYVTWSLKRPLSDLTPTLAIPAVQAKVPAGNLTWPAAGQAAVGIPGTTILEKHGLQNPLPIASAAKVITALAVLEKKPLAPGEQGPVMTVTERDVASYNAYVAADGSVTKVVAGEQLSEYQMLQAIMLPSANNIADSMAIWTFGSLPAYSEFANKYVEKLGLLDTHVGSDASGLAPDTVSTAQDLVKLGEVAMRNPVLKQIVSQQIAALPVVNEVRNVNFLLGTDNIIGIKTGNTDEAGGVFVGAAQKTVNGKQVVIVTTVAGAPSLFAAMKDSQNLIRSAQNNFRPVTIAKDNTLVGTYKVPWGGTVAAETTGSLTTTGWAGSTVTARPELRPIPADTRAGQTVGSVTLPKSGLTDEKSVAVKLKNNPAKPSAWWRLTHPLQ